MKYAVVVTTLATAGRYALLLFPVLCHSFSVELHFTLWCCPIHGTVSVAKQSGEMCTAWRLGRIQCM